MATAQIASMQQWATWLGGTDAESETFAQAFKTALRNGQLPAEREDAAGFRFWTLSREAVRNYLDKHHGARPRKLWPEQTRHRGTAEQKIAAVAERIARGNPSARYDEKIQMVTSEARCSRDAARAVWSKMSLSADLKPTAGRPKK